VNKKNFMIAGLVAVGTLVLFAEAGCSSDSSTGSSSSGFSCPAVGSKNCDKDEPVTQAAYDLCKKCESELKASATCQGQTAAPKCGADGKSETQQSDPNKCKAESDAVLKCILGGSTGGGDAGG
jgi:hypothetical protein